MILQGLGGHMKRRYFITLLSGAAVLWPLVARAQQSGHMRRIGVLIGGLAEGDPEGPPRVVAFQQALEQLGWSEGRNVRIVYRWGAGDTNQMRASAKELIGVAPDVVVTESKPALAAMRQETGTTPIVFLFAGDPVASGLVASIAHPGGNITGFTGFEPQMVGKWMELIKEIAPRIVRVAAIFNPDTHIGAYWLTLETVAPALALEVTAAPVRDVAEIERAIDALAHEQNGGLLVLPDIFTIVHRKSIVTSTAQHRVPAVYPYRFFVTGGGLVSYGIDIVDLYRRGATYVDRILKGEKPADLPVQAPTKFELVINFKTAKALGLEMPPALLARADEVIE
jgi:putative tryptophan/tyrosine transport system substrate-binding protein